MPRRTRANSVVVFALEHALGDVLLEVNPADGLFPPETGDFITVEGKIYRVGRLSHEMIVASSKIKQKVTVVVHPLAATRT